MAYLPFTDQLKKQQEASALAQSAPAAGSASGAPSTGAAPAAPSNPSTFINLQDYLAPNQGQAQEMGRSLASQLDTQASGAAKAASDYANAYSQWDTQNQQAQAKAKDISDAQAWMAQHGTETQIANPDYAAWLKQQNAAMNGTPTNPNASPGVSRTTHDPVWQSDAGRPQSPPTPSTIPDRYIPNPDWQKYSELSKEIAPTVGAAPSGDAAAAKASQVLGEFSAAKQDPTALLGQKAGYTEGQRGLDSYLLGRGGMDQVNQTIDKWNAALQGAGSPPARAPGGNNPVPRQVNTSPMNYGTQTQGLQGWLSDPSRQARRR